MKAKIINYLFPKKSSWIDISMHEDSGYYNLIQMRYRLDNNKKEFRKAKMGFINDYKVKSFIYGKVISKNNND